LVDLWAPGPERR